MGVLIDIFPIIIFFAVYKLSNIFAATAAAIVISAIQVIFCYFKHHKLQPLQLITFVILLVLGTTTIILHNAIFIKWKPSVIYWLFAIAFLITQFGKKTLIQYVMGSKIELPDNVWKKLNISWVVFFTLMGFLNIYVVYHYSTNAWVNFKLFGILGLTFLFVLIQALFMSRYVVEKS